MVACYYRHILAMPPEQLLAVMVVEQYTLKDYVNAFKRRSKLFFGSFFVVLGTALALALMLSDQYRSSAELRIDLTVPNIDELEPVILTNYADQYIQTLAQEVMTNDNLRTWLDESNAYQYEGDEVSTGELIGRLEEDIQIRMVFTSVIEERSGKEVDLITGFTTSFVGRDPEAAKIIANNVANAFLSEDRAVRVERASTASTFLTEQIDAKREEIAEIEAKIATFKEDNAGKLPELMVLNMTSLERIERELEGTERQIRNQRQDKLYREAQLADIRHRVDGDPRQLAELEAEYNRAISLYGPDHPDVIRIQRQVAVMTGGAAGDSSSPLAQLEAQLAVARETYSEEHPDVIRLKRRIDDLRSKSPLTGAGDATETNPRYLQLSAEINAIDTNLASLGARAVQLRVDRADLEDRIASMPQVERQFQVLERDLQTATLAFDGLRERLAQAEQIESFESGDRGARLALIRRAEAPRRPSGPPRLAIFVVGLFLATTVAGIAAFFAEFSDSTVRGSKDIQIMMNTPTLAMIPVMQNSVSRSLRRQQIVGISAVAFAIAAAFVAIAALRMFV